MVSWSFDAPLIRAANIHEWTSFTAGAQPRSASSTVEAVNDLSDRLQKHESPTR
jgi:hypothetical protein